MKLKSRLNHKWNDLLSLFNLFILFVIHNGSLTWCNRAASFNQPMKNRNLWRVKLICEHLENFIYWSFGTAWTIWRSFKFMHAFWSQRHATVELDVFNHRPLKWQAYMCALIWLQIERMKRCDDKYENNDAQFNVILINIVLHSFLIESYPRNCFRHFTVDVKKRLTYWMSI